MSAAKKTAAAKQAAPKAAPAASAAAPAGDAATQGSGAEQERDDAAGQSDADSQAETIQPAKGEVFVLARKGLDRFHRCGMRFTREPTVLVVAELGEGVLERLKAETNLTVIEG